MPRLTAPPGIVTEPAIDELGDRVRWRGSDARSDDACESRGSGLEGG